MIRKYIYGPGIDNPVAIIRRTILFNGSSSAPPGFNGRHGKNFVNTILGFARQKPSLRVVNDQRGCPTFAPELAATLQDYLWQL